MFKEAVRKDPTNQEARHNYELLLRFQKYPEVIMKKVRSLIRDRRYLDAYALLEDKVTNDARFKKEEQVLKRLADIVKIDNEIE